MTTTPTEIPVEPPPSDAALEAAGEFVYIEYEKGRDDPAKDDHWWAFFVGGIGIDFDGERERAETTEEELVSDLARRMDAFAAAKLEANRVETEKALRALVRDVPPGVTVTTLRDHAFNTGISLALQALGFTAE